MHLKLRPYLVILLGVLLLLVTACNQDNPDTATPTAESETATQPAESEETVPTAEPEANEPSVPFVPFEDDELGLSLQYPEGWVTQSGFGGATIASSQSAIDAESLADIGEEAFIVVIPGEIEYFNFQTGQSFSEDDVLQALATYKVLLENEGQEFVTVEPPLLFTNDNQKMARIVLRSVEDGAPLTTVMAVVMEDGYMALISAASLEGTADEMRPIFNQIIESIHVRPSSTITDGG